MLIWFIWQNIPMAGLLWDFGCQIIDKDYNICVKIYKDLTEIENILTESSLIPYDTRESKENIIVGP